MTSENSDNSGNKDATNPKSGAQELADAPKRPSRVIELEAEEIAAADKTAGDTGADEGAGPDNAPEKDGGHKGAPRSAPLPQQTAPSELKGFVTHLAAGLAGGLIGVVGAGIGLDKLPLSAFTGGGTGPDRIAQLEQRLAQVDNQVAGQSKALDGVARTENLDSFAARLQAIEDGAGKAANIEALAVRLKAIEDTSETAPAIPEQAAERLGKLEDTLKTLVSAAGEEGASGLEQSAALSAKIDAVSSDFKTRAEALGGEITALKASLLERDKARREDADSILSSLAARAQTLEDKLSGLAARAQSTGQPQAAPGASGGAALALAFERLRRTVERGEAYSAQLEALGRLAPDTVDVSQLTGQAGTGIETKAALLGALPELLRKADAAAEKHGDGTFMERLKFNARSVVRIRRIGPAEGNSSSAVLARMEMRMKASDIAGIVREAGALTGPALAQIKPWLDRAQARQSGMARLNALEKSLLTSLDSGAQAQR